MTNPTVVSNVFGNAVNTTAPIGEIACRVGLGVAEYQVMFRARVTQLLQFGSTGC